MLDVTNDEHLDLVLDKAAQTGQLEIVMLAVERGANSRWNALQHAATAGKLDVVQWLVQEANTRPHDGAAMRAAAAAGELEVVQWLINKAGVKGSNWALLDAVAAHQLEVVRWLVTETNITNLDGALQYAVERGSSSEMLQLLIELGAKAER